MLWCACTRRILAALIMFDILLYTYFLHAFLEGGFVTLYSKCRRFGS